MCILINDCTLHKVSAIRLAQLTMRNCYTHITLSTYDVFLQLPDLHNYIVNQMQTAHANKQRYQRL